MMIDTERTVKWLYEAQCLLEDRIPKKYRGAALQAVKDAQEALKEQPEIVRCKDCLYRHTNNCFAKEAGLANVSDDWFCADGDRKEGR